MPDRLATAAALREIAALLDVTGENRFKVRAWEKGARALEALNASGAQLADEAFLLRVPGIGRALAGAIVELAETGTSRLLLKLRERLPAGVLELLQVPGLTVRRIALLQEELGVTTVAQLQDACVDGRLRGVKGFGEKLVTKIQAGIATAETRGEELLLHHAEHEAQALAEFVRTLPGVRAVDVAGAVRRRQETAAAVVLAASSDDPRATLDAFTGYPPAVAVVGQDAESATLRLGNGVLARLEVGASHAATLLAATGSDGHHARLVALARERGLVLDRTGLREAASGSSVPVAAEADVYRHLDLPYLPPEVREDAGEIEAARAGALAADDLLTEADVRGMVHCHTDWSDGKNTIEEMGRAADAMGMEYLTITDHSPAAHYANGLTVERLLAQWEEIARVQASVRVRLLRGVECDILADGSLDVPDKILGLLDVVIASIHNRHKMDAQQMTRRLITMMRLPYFKIWGHALGRYVLSRPPIECDVEAVLDAAAHSRVAIEVNGDPHRLDLAPKWQRKARDRGLKFVVSTDAHSTGQLANLRYGVAMARRGWVRKDETLNTLGADEFRQRVRP